MGTGSEAVVRKGLFWGQTCDISLQDDKHMGAPPWRKGGGRLEGQRGLPGRAIAGWCSASVLVSMQEDRLLKVIPPMGWSFRSPYADRWKYMRLYYRCREAFVRHKRRVKVTKLDYEKTCS